MESLTCEYCNKSFRSYRSVQVHKKTTKYCLKLRGINYDNSHTCEFCGAHFTQKSTLKSHFNSCPEAKIAASQNDIEILENKIKKLEEKVTELSEEKVAFARKNNKLVIKIRSIESQNTQLTAKIAKKDILSSQLNAKITEQNKEIVSLRECVSEKEGVTKGILIGIEKAKPQVVNKITNNIVKQKLAAIPIGNIEPFTIDLVNRNIDKYDYITFMQGSLGIVNYIKGITILEMTDGTIEKNYACTNRSRNTFHRLVEDKNWKQDGGARFIQEIFSALSNTASEHMDTLADEIKALPVRSDRKRWLVEEEAKLRDIETGLKKKDSKEREELFMQVKNQIKETNNC